METQGQWAASLLDFLLRQAEICLLPVPKEKVPGPEQRNCSGSQEQLTLSKAPTPAGQQTTARVFINKVLLRHSHICPFVYCLWLLPDTIAEWIVAIETGLKSLKYFYPKIFLKYFYPLRKCIQIPALLECELKGFLLLDLVNCFCPHHPYMT